MTSPARSTFVFPDEIDTEMMRPLTTVERTAAAQWVAQLSALIRLRRPQVDAWIEGGTLPREVVAGAIVAAIARKLSNPDGKIQEAVDDYSYRRADALADGSLYIADADWALLQPPAVSGARKRSVRLSAYGQ